MSNQKTYQTQSLNPALLLAIIFCLACLNAATPLVAEPPASRWILRGYAASLSQIDDRVTVDRTSATLSEQTTHSISDGSGFGLSLELMVTKKLGVELFTLFGDLDTDFRLDSGSSSFLDREDLGTEMFSLGVNYHLTPHRRVDFFVGAFVAMSTFDDVIFLTEAGLREKLTFDDDFGFGLKAGIDVRLQPESHWFLTAEVRYLLTILESEVPGQDLDLDPVIASLGIGYRF